MPISPTTNRVNGWTYDAAGNVTNDGSHTYQYDAENRLIKIDGGSTAQYAYGPQGERVSKIAAGVTTYFYWGIGEKVSGQWTKLYVSGLGGKLVEYSAGTTWFFATNHLGTIAARMNVGGQLMETYRYLPYGERYAGTQTPHQYTGKERDNESGLDYFGARYYASAHGRWMSVDPVVRQQADPQSLNRYSYVRSDPMNKIDVDGRLWLWGNCQWLYDPHDEGVPHLVCYPEWVSETMRSFGGAGARGGGGGVESAKRRLMIEGDSKRLRELAKDFFETVGEPCADALTQAAADHPREGRNATREGLMASLSATRFINVDNPNLEDMLVSDLPGVPAGTGQEGMTVRDYIDGIPAHGPFDATTLPGGNVLYYGSHSTSNYIMSAHEIGAHVFLGVDDTTAADWLGLGEGLGWEEASGKITIWFVGGCQKDSDGKPVF
ncbi:MAG: RHS repeat-associated core domain-containing protein [Acidobacteriota bacterium]